MKEKTTSFSLLFGTPNSIREISRFLTRVVLQKGNSLLTGAESRVTLRDLLPTTIFCGATVDSRMIATPFWPGFPLYRLATSHHRIMVDGNYLKASYNRHKHTVSAAMYPPAAPKLFVNVPIIISISLVSTPKYSATPRPLWPRAPML